MGRIQCVGRLPVELRSVTRRMPKEFGADCDAAWRKSQETWRLRNVTP
jgi:hypothetical protein